MAIVMRESGEVLLGTAKALIFSPTAMSLLVSTFTGKPKATVSIDGRTEILTVEHLLKGGKKAKVFGKSQA